MLVSLQSSP